MDLGLRKKRKSAQYDRSKGNYSKEDFVASLSWEEFDTPLQRAYAWYINVALSFASLSSDMARANCLCLVRKLSAQ